MSELVRVTREPRKDCKLRAIRAFKWVVLPLAIVFLTEPMYRQHFYDETLSEAPDMQDITKLKAFFENISYLG